MNSQCRKFKIVLLPSQHALRSPFSEPPDDGSRPSVLSQLQMVELLVAHGASLDTKSVLEETPLGEALHPGPGPHSSHPDPPQTLFSAQLPL